MQTIADLIKFYIFIARPITHSMKLKNCVVVLIHSALFCYCNSKQDNKNTAPITKQNPFVGEWHFNNTIWHTSQLTLKSNGTFRFYSKGCSDQNFTEGKWIAAMNGIVLSSFDNYKPKEDSTKTTCYSKAAIPLKKGTFILTSLPENIKVNYPEPNDTLKIYLKECLLFLNNDTLVCADKGMLKGSKFAKTKNI